MRNFRLAPNRVHAYVEPDDVINSRRCPISRQRSNPAQATPTKLRTSHVFRAAIMRAAAVFGVLCLVDKGVCIIF